MQRNVQTIAITVVFSAVATALWIAPAAAQQPLRQFTVRALPLVGVDADAILTSSGADGVNDFGQIIGEEFGFERPGPSFAHALLWTKDKPTFLPANFDTYANAINDRAQVVGKSFTTGSGGGNFSGVDAELWQNGHATALPGLPVGVGPFNPVADALDINNAGLIVGWSNVGNFEDTPSTFTQHAVLWNSSHRVPVDIGAVAGLTAPSFALATNNRGQIFGATGLLVEQNEGTLWFESTAQAIEWDVPGGLLLGKKQTRVRDLGAFTPTAANDLGEVVGVQVNAAGAEQAIVSQLGRVRVLRPLPGDTTAGALDVNELGQVVGFSGGSARDVRGRFVTGSTHAVMWTAEGNPVALPDLPGDTTSVARGINNRGDIVGSSGDSAVAWTAHP